MNRARLAALAFMLLSLMAAVASAQAPPLATIGVYADSLHLDADYETLVPYDLVTFYIWCRPGENGMMCAEFAVEKPSSASLYNLAVHPDVSVILGVPETGASVCFLSCHEDWTWVCRQDLVVTDASPAIIRLVDHPTAGEVKVATCLENFPTEPAVPYPALGLNMSRTLDVTPPMQEMVTVTNSRRIVARFSEIMFPHGMDDPANYLLYETGWPDGPIDIVHAERSGGGDVVVLDLARPLVTGVVHTLEVSNLVDMAGNPLAGSPATFMGQDDDPPSIVSADVPDESHLVLVFSEPLEPGMAEEINNYSITPTGASPVPGVTAATLRGDGMTVDLAVSPPLVEGESYLVRADDVIDISGNPVGPTGLWFAIDDLQPPGIDSVRVTDLRRIDVVFTEPIDQTSGTNAGNYEIHPKHEPEADVPVTSVSVSGPVAVLTTGADLSTTRIYTLEVANVTDLAGNPVPPGTSMDFTVGDIVPPRLYSVEALDYLEILAGFSEAMDSASIADPANFTLVEYSDPSVEIGIVAAEALPWEPYNGYWRSRLALADSLVEGRRYTLRAHGVTDEAGLAIDPEYAEKWFTMPERDRPSIAAVEVLSLERLRVTFDEMMELGSSIAPASYGLWERDDTTAVVPVDSVVMVDALLNFELLLGASLDPSVWYALSAAGAEDLAGNAVGPGREVDFHPSDNLPPSIAGAAGAGEHLADVVFSEPVEQATAGDPSNYAVWRNHDPADSLPVTGASLGPDTVSVRLTLAGDPLFSYVTYTVRVSNVRDLVGHVIEEGSWVDFVLPDTTRPGIDSVEVRSPSLLIVRFDEPVTVATSGDAGSYRLYPDGVPADSVPIVMAMPEQDGCTVGLELGRALAYETPYLLGAPGVEDRSGNPVGPGREYSFSVAEIFPPVLESAFADSDSSAVLLFDEALDETSAEETANYAVHPAGSPGEGLPLLEAILLPEGDRVRLVSGDRFEKYVEYVAEATGVEDLAGNATPPGTAASFVLPDSIPPVLVSAAAVSRTYVDVVFDERMDAASLADIGHYLLAVAGDTAQHRDVLGAEPLPDAASVRLSVAALDYGVRYLLAVSNVVDLAGNPIMPGSSVEFVAEDTVPPELLSVTIAGANEITARFSEAVDTTTAGDPAHYAVWLTEYPAETIEVTAASPSGDRVVLTLAETPAPNVWYTLAVTGVADREGNLIAPDTREEFRRVTLPPAGYIGLYADAQHSDCTVMNPGGFLPFEMWVWCLPSDLGMMCAEFAIRYPLNIIASTVSVSPLVSVYLGDLATGMSACLSECAWEWTWLFSQQCYLTDTQSSAMEIIPHPDVGVIQFANCEPGYPLHPCWVVNHLYLNDWWMPATLLESFDAKTGDGGVSVRWKLVEADEDASFLVSRAAGEEGDDWTALDASGIEREELSFSFFDGAVEEGASYRYRVAVEEIGGGEPRVLFETEPVDIPRLPLALRQNRPNPFNPSTEVRFHLPAATRVRLDVFDVRGRRVAVLVDGRLPAGEHVAAWDGRDASGSACSSGVYFCRLAAGKERRSIKMVLLR